MRVRRHRRAARGAGGEDPTGAPFWTGPAARLLADLGTTPAGLSAAEAASRLERYGPNTVRPSRRTGAWLLLLSQFRSPVTLLLLAAAILSIAVGETTDGLTICGIVVVSALLGFWQERGAAGAVEALLAMVRTHVNVLRGGDAAEIPIEGVVPGDVVLLAAGDAVPGDGRILEARDLFVDEAALTGESYPAEKEAGELPGDTPLTERTNALFFGTHVVSGTATALIVATGADTLFGALAERLEHRPPETDFARGVRRFGYLLLEVTLVLVIFIFAVNVALRRPALDALLFTLALAVGLTPQLLPAIVAVTLAQGARRMAARQVIVRRLESIESFGSMTVLCTDKTGTLTEGAVRLEGALDSMGHESRTVAQLAYLNAAFETGYANPIDLAIRAQPGFDTDGWRKLDEVPYDFVRKRLSVLVEHDGERLLATKGALAQVLDACATVALADGHTEPLDAWRPEIERRVQALGVQGLRCLGVASRTMPGEAPVGKADEAEMTFAGILTLLDPVKPGVIEQLGELRALGISLKLVTGDNRHVAAAVAAQVGMDATRLVTGAELRETSAEALRRQALDTEVFAEVEPNQKERIILSLKTAGIAVGYLGDGINDAPALHAADVGISVESATDVTRQAADIVLLRKGLDVLVGGVRAGRSAFGNTLKYIFITTSANFGNMFSMAGASLLVPFLPLLPEQILLINVLTDVPAIAISGDRLDPEMTATPQQWDDRFIRNYMITFGLVSSLFDFLTFGTLLALGVAMARFRTGWFIESVLSEILILLVIRTRRPFFRSRPGTMLLVASVAVATATLALPWLPVARPLGLAPLPGRLVLVLATIVAAYVLASELAKRVLFHRLATGDTPRDRPARASSPRT